MIKKQDIINAIQNLELFLKVSDLKGAKVKLNKDGRPFVYTGGFTMVFQLSVNNTKWAFRVWHVPLGETQKRFASISSYLINKNLSYFADFIYDKSGLLVNGELFDTIRMKWLEGDLLKAYIEKNLYSRKILESLANNFLSMSEVLKKNKISHGDLQEGNILITNKGEIKLIDYDSVCVPEIIGQRELITGKQGYQHPSRFSSTQCSLKADYFSELIIYLSILSFSEKPDLWHKYNVNTSEVLLFTQGDFQDFGNSKIRADLLNLSPQIKGLVNILETYLQEINFNTLLPLSTYLHPPRIIKFNCAENEKEIVATEEIILTWEVENAIKVIIEGIGSVNIKGSKKVLLNENTTFRLLAFGYFQEISSDPISIKVHPIPLISEFKLRNEKIAKGESTQLEWQVSHAEKIFLNGVEVTNKTKRGKGLILVTPYKDTQFVLTAQSFQLRKTVSEKREVKVFATANIFSSSVSLPEKTIYFLLAILLLLCSAFIVILYVFYNN